MSAIIAVRPDYDWNDHLLDNLAALIQVMDEAKDKDGDPVYDYYSMAYWVVKYMEENKNA